ncbi:N-acetylglucosamine-1-phosphotransferase subunit gamma-like [Hyalella azteca]|uniref:N-acetylglucosamine-1-phosphotransferase subunit gamma-like n=1 Tax=Hyalella azteca TaxID=294128 RepID=A0A8B7NWF3_HYAAZ|nr:N-acetylglucosamine-1-phosphotransferase subunit gamma-like [Hyalella azteca]
MMSSYLTLRICAILATFLVLSPALVDDHLIRVVNWPPGPANENHNLHSSSGGSGERLQEYYAPVHIAAAKPSNFTGPDHLRPIINSCYKFLDAKYEYQVCMFKSFSQKEVGSSSTHHLSPTRSLGVWRSWEIENGQFRALLYDFGHACSTNSTVVSHRKAKVELQCGAHPHIASVEEPSKCFYVAVVVTPLVCGDDSVMAVYPRLQHHHRHHWDQLFTDWRSGLYTDAGYRAALEQLYRRAGLINDASLVEGTSCADCLSRLEELQQRILELESKLYALKDV